MADKTTVRLTNIKSFTQGSDRYYGIKSVSVQVQAGNLVATKDEGSYYPTGAYRFGVSDFPVKFTVESDSLEALLTLLAVAASDLVIVCQTESGTDKTCTIQNVSYLSSSLSQQRDAHGNFSIQGVAYCDTATPTVLPIAFA